MDEVIKEYTNGEVTIVWKPAMCVHSRICWGKDNSLPEVFNPKERPWIKPEGAGTERIIAQIKQCPSGALTFHLNETEVNPSSMNEVDSTIETVIEALPNGPLLIFGNIKVKDKEGNMTKKTNATAFCRCGGSGNKPFCDGSHVGIDFKG